MSALVPPEDLPKWVPGEVLCSSDGLDWKDVYLRTYHYLAQDTIVPAMRDFMIVGYRLGITPMQRRFDGAWTREICRPGSVSLLTRAEQSHWFWTETIDVTHLYLSQELVLDVASEMMERPISNVALADVLRLEDPAVTKLLEAIAAEANIHGLGGPLYVESLTRALVVQLLRKFAHVLPAHADPHGGLTTRQVRSINDFIDAKLSESITLAGLAKVAGLTPSLFARKFKRTTGIAPYAYVIMRRLQKAQRLLTFSPLAIKEIVAECGFADQAHFTRLFVRSREQTPAAFRREYGKRIVEMPT